jgi:protein-disulfide isomerase
VSDLLYQSILERLASPGSQPMNAAALLAEAAGDDPRLAAFIRALQERQAAATADNNNDAKPEGSASELAENLQDFGGSAGELEELTSLMASELELLRARNDMLAAALGACHLCWGEDPQCPYCGGVGGVGKLMIDRAIFRQVVVPALRQLRSRPAVASPRFEHPQSSEQTAGKEGGDYGNQ